MKFFGKKTREIKKANQHRIDENSNLVPLTAIEYEDLMNRILDAEKKSRQLGRDLDTAYELLNIHNRHQIFSPKIERSVKYSLSRLAMRITAAKSPDEVVKLIDHATERAGMFLKTFSINGDLGKFEKQLFIDEDMDGVITVQCEE